MQSTRRRLTVLLVEDAPANQTLVVRLLEKRGHQVLVASNGREAIALYEATSVDLILMDLQMPVMDGFEATKAIRRLHHGGRKPVPIVALSVHNSRQDRERCLLAGMDACIAKPIDMNQLIELVESLAAKQPAATKDTNGSASPVNCRAALGRLEGDYSLLLELMRLFERDAPELINRIARALSTSAPSEVSLAAHTLKGLAANFDAHRAAAAAGELEALATSGDLKQGAALLERLKRELDQALQAIRAFCAETSHLGSAR